METTRRMIVAAALAGGSMLLMTSGALASGGDSHGGGRAANPAQQSTTQSQPAGSSCDVPGRACDPSKTDHDNGVGNNCDPGYGRGNQAKFPADEAESGCRTSSTKPQSGTQKPAESTPRIPGTAPSPLCSAAVAHQDNESASGEMHESTTAESHDSGVRSESGDCVSGVETAGTAPITLETVTTVLQSKTVTLTFVVTTPNGEVKTVVVTINRGESAPVTVTVNGEQVTLANLMAVLGGQVVVTQTSGGYTITLPTGMVLAITGTNVTVTGPNVSTSGTTVAPGTTTEVGGVQVANQTPAGTTGAGRTTAPSGTSAAASVTLPGGSLLGSGAVSGAVSGLAANAAAGVGGAASAAEGMPLASTGLPLVAGLLGLLLFGTGFIARRRR